MRSQCGQRRAGSGTDLSFFEAEDMYTNFYNGCKLPHDDLLEKDKHEELAGLSSEVIEYNLADLGGERNG